MNWMVKAWKKPRTIKYGYMTNKKVINTLTNNINKKSNIITK